MASTRKDMLQHVDPLLREPRRRVPRAENARLLWERELPRVGLPPCLDGADGDSWFGRYEAPEELQRWLADHHHDLGTLERGLALGDFQLPTARSMEASFPHALLGGMEGVCRARELRARLLAQDGQTAAAAREVTTLLDVGDLVLRRCDQLLAYLALLEFTTRRSIACLRGVLRLVPQDSEVLETWLEHIVTRNPEPVGIRPAFAGEFQDQLLPLLLDLDGARDRTQFLEVLAEALTPIDSMTYCDGDLQRTKRGLESLLRDHDRPFEVLPTIELASDCFATCLRSLETPWTRRARFPVGILREILQIWPDSLRASWVPGPVDVPCRLAPAKARPRIAATENPAGKMIVASLLGALEWTLCRTMAVRAERLATTVLVALEIYQRRHGQAPTGLDGLVRAGILDEIPCDPVAGGEVGYCPLRGVLWLPSSERVNRRYTLDPANPRPGKDLIFLLPPWLEVPESAGEDSGAGSRRTGVRLARALAGDLQQLFASLPEIERVVLELACGNDGHAPLPIREIAAQLAMPTLDIEQLLERALGRLEPELER